MDVPSTGSVTLQTGVVPIANGSALINLGWSSNESIGGPVILAAAKPSTPHALSLRAFQSLKKTMTDRLQRIALRPLSAYMDT